MISEFFVAEGDALLPRPGASSGWSTDAVRGPALTAALARAAEPLCPDGMRPARAVFELFRQARFAPLVPRAETIRRGGRLCVVDTFLSTDGIDVARAHVTFARPSDEPDGQTWRPRIDARVPSPDSPADEEGRLYRGTGEWTRHPTGIASTEAKSTWQANRVLVAGEQPTPFQLAASASDLTSLVVHWGTSGLQFINADIALSLARLPVGAGVGVRVVDAITADGISAGSSVLFDEVGPFGTLNLIGLANAAHAVRFGVDRTVE